MAESAYSRNGATPNLQGEAFDLDALRLPQNYADVVGVQKVFNNVPVTRPDRQWFVRTHPDREAYTMVAALLLLKQDRETYLVTPSALAGAGAEAQPSILHAAINRQGSLFLWPTRLPGHDGRDNPWYQTDRDAAEYARRAWVSVRANTDARIGGYELFVATAEIPEPEWPPMTFPELVKLAFHGKIIADPQHDVLLRLAGAR
jgi:hypothetical protein